MFPYTTALGQAGHGGEGGKAGRDNKSRVLQLSLNFFDFSFCAALFLISLSFSFFLFCSWHLHFLEEWENFFNTEFHLSP